MARLLIVDDEAIITMQLEERLTAMGYTVVGMAAGGEDAVEKARKFTPDLILMDIVMPGKVNGIEAARIIRNELDIPVIFVTSYADDKILEEAKHVRPYGYIVKPFDERGLKATIEVALFRKQIENDQPPPRTPVIPDRTQAGNHIPAGSEPGYMQFPEIKTILLGDIFSDILLYLYTDNTLKDLIFKSALEESIKRGRRSLFTYYKSTLPKHFLPEMQDKKVQTFRMKPQAWSEFGQVFDQCMQSSPDETGDPVNIILDFSDTGEFDEILAVKDRILSKKGGGTLVSGIIAVNIGDLDHGKISQLAGGIPKIIVSTGRETTFSFARQTFPPDAVSVVSQEIIDEVVKKSLEPVVLSMLGKPMSGYDIVHEIHTRYNVLIPQARVYTLLSGMEKQGMLEVKMSGKSKLYCPTPRGRDFIGHKLIQYKRVFHHILGEETEGLKGPDLHH